MDIFTNFLSNDGSASRELEYRYACSKPEYDTVLRFLRNMDGLKQVSPSVSLNVIFGKGIRMSLSGTGLIEYYCARNSIPPSEWANVSIGIKQRLDIKAKSNNSNITLSEETEHVFADLIKDPELLETTSDDIKAVVKESSMTNRIELAMYRKLFRLRSRTSFLWKDLLRVDITRVKENSVKYDLNDRKVSNLYLTMQEANLNKQALKYEIEVEVIKPTVEAVEKMKTLIDEIEELLGTDESKSQLNPIHMKAYSGAINLLIASHYDYLTSNPDITLVDGPVSKDDAIRRYNNSKKSPYIIPKLVSMTKNNLPIPEDMAITDKADGDSCIVMVAKNEMVVFDSGFRMLGQTRDIGATMGDNVSLFAGEYIENDTAEIPHKTVYLYDCYMINGEDMRRLKLVSNEDEPTRIKKVEEFASFTQSGEPAIGDGIRIRSKKMLLGDPYEVSKRVWESKHTYPYTLDGIIFTPASTPVAQSAENPVEWGYKMDRTWHLNFKWKPPEFNTVDFILEWSSGIVRGKDGLVRKGILRSTETVEKHGIKATVFPLFQATEYVKPKTYAIEVVVDSTREARTEETNEFIQNHSVVECRYDTKNDEWIVLRNRKDKTKVWENTRQTLETSLSKYRTLVAMANQSGTIDNWSRSIIQKIFAVGRKAREIKQAKLSMLLSNIKNFLVFHDVIPQSSTPKDLYRHLKDKKEQIMNLLNESYVAVPLPFGLSGSNSTYVANTIWKSIHEPVYIDSFRQQGASSGAGSDLTGSAIEISTEKLIDLPIGDDVNQRLVERVRSWVADVDAKSVMELSDRDVPIVKEGLLWTNKEGIRQSPLITRGDARRPTTGWINSDDKKIWNAWKKETGGASVILSMGIWGAVGTISHRKGVISSITNSAKSSGAKAVIVYWDPAKIEMISKTDVDAKKKRGGHLIYKDVELTAYAKDKMVKEFGDKGWSVDTDNTWTIHDIVADDPLAKFLSVMVFKN